MKPSDQDRLLRGILDDENVQRLRDDSLARGLDGLRRRRRRRVVLTGAATAAVLLIAVVFTLRRRMKPIADVPGMPIAAAKLAHVKFIDDQQLLAHFSDRSVALLGRPGHQQLLFLDAPAGLSSRAENR